MTSLSGIYPHLYPNLLIVASKNQTRQNINKPSVLKTGRARSVLFKYDGDLESVTKIPNRNTYSESNAREDKILESIRGKNPEIQESLPKGNTFDSPLGKIRKEKAVSGNQLSNILKSTSSNQSSVVRDTLNTGLKWLIKLQDPDNQERAVFNLESYISSLEIQIDDEYLPQIPDQSELFYSPVHGDFNPKNIYMKNGNISTVIDWEYGIPAGNPIIDVGFFISNVLSYGEKPAYETMIEISRGSSSTAQIGRNAIEKYCENVNIDTQVFLKLLPIVYVHQTNIDYNMDKYLTMTSKRLDGGLKAWRHI